MPSFRTAERPSAHGAIVSALAFTLLATGADTSLALTHDRHAQPAARSAQPHGLEVASGPRARLQPDVAWDHVPEAAAAAWQAFLDRTGATWTALWDADTAAPTRVFGPGIAMPDSVSSAGKAETYARAFLAEHIDLLAPGSRPEDFRVVGNHLAAGIRTVGMRQYHHGMQVIGGQVSFRFKNDRLFVIAAEALPHVDVPPMAFSASATVAADAASAWMRASAGDAWTSAVDGPHVLPVISHRQVTYHAVMRATVEAREPLGRFHAYLDAATAAPVAREQLLRFAEGTLLYNVPLRTPAAERADLPASHAEILAGTLETATDAGGLVSWDGDAPLELTATVTGPLVAISNQIAPSEQTSASFLLEPGGTAVWDERDDELVDAQLSTFMHAHVAKEHARRFAPDLAYLDEQLLARVNIDNTCNAYSDGTTINFFRASERCENTARLADVVYHEFGHALHWQSIIPGVGRFDGAFSEGLSDYLAATITNDPAMAIGFFRDDEPLRHIDPEGFEHRWPRDIGEIHYTGLIFAGAMWDLREALVEEYGYEEGVALADRLFYAAVQRASSIPATYVEILAADDDDGNLANGTPHECLINKTFGALHGLRDIRAVHDPVGAQPPTREDYLITTQVTGLSDRCDGDKVKAVTVRWEQRDTGAGDEIVARPVAGATPGLYTATIPQQPDGSVVRYRVVVELADGGVWEFPDNPAAPDYEFYVGELVELYCTDFESDPFAEGWRHGLAAGTRDAGADDWEWGAPAGQGDDPPAAFSGSSVLGNDLGGDGYDGLYQPDKVNYVESPAVDVGDYSDVRVQYRRWLTVEDARWDHATIYANGHRVWRNARTARGQSHHLDREWRFHDIPVSRFITGGTLQVRFELASDAGLEFGGWNIDDFCVVARPDAICGNGTVEGAERCDDGEANSDTEPNACRTNCRRSFCGDGVLDRYEQCDDGNRVSGDGCTAACYLPPASGGCSAHPGARSAAGALSLAALALVALALRRRRRV